MMLKDLSTQQLFDKPLLAALIGSIAAIAKAIITLIGKPPGTCSKDLSLRKI